MIDQSTRCDMPEDLYHVRTWYVPCHIVMRRLTMGIRSSKCVVRRFRRCANAYLHKLREYNIAYSRLYGIAQCFSTFVRPRPGKFFFS